MSLHTSQPTSAHQFLLSCFTVQTYLFSTAYLFLAVLLRTQLHSQENSARSHNLQSLSSYIKYKAEHKDMQKATS